MNSALERRFLFLLGSTRRDGNTERLARLAAQSLSPQSAARWVHVSELALPAFDDLRHAAHGAYSMPEGDAKVLLDDTLWATDLVFASPTYWYNLPASIKLYLDHWSGWLRVPGVDFKQRMAGKSMWVITVNADEPGEDSGGSAPLVKSLELSADYLHMNFAGTLIGHANRPGEIVRDAEALRLAATFFNA